MSGPDYRAPHMPAMEYRKLYYGSTNAFHALQNRPPNPTKAASTLSPALEPVSVALQPSFWPRKA
jgi:hypothetical protein